MEFNLGLISNIYLLILLVILIFMTLVITKQVIDISIIDYKYWLLNRRSLSLLVDSKEYLIFSRILVLKKLWFEAIEFLELTSVRMNHRDSYFLNTFGCIYESLGNYSLAEKYYLDATVSDTCCLVALRNLANIYIKTEKEYLAYLVYANILDCDPNNTFAKKEYLKLVSKYSG